MGLGVKNIYIYCKKSPWAAAAGGRRVGGGGGGGKKVIFLWFIFETFFYNIFFYITCSGRIALVDLVYGDSVPASCQVLISIEYAHISSL